MIVFLCAILFVLAADPARGEDGQRAGAAIPDPYKLDLMVRTTMSALSQANATGNYSVFRELAAPGFQAANSTGRLFELFAALRKQNMDLSPLIFVQPKLFREPSVENGMLRLTGFFPTQPQQIDFDLVYQPVNRSWLLFAVAVNVVPAPAATAGLQQAPGGRPAQAPQPEAAVDSRVDATKAAAKTAPKGK